MKRTLLQRGAIIAACAAAFVFAACGDNPEFDARTDTVYSLDTPSVTAKAYPGVNVVSWKPVTGAKEYKVSVYEEGVYKGTLPNISGNSGWDTDLKNDKVYTYYVEAVSNSNPATMAREVYATNSRGEASARAIVPPVGTKSLELPAYESGYDGKNVKTVSENDEGIVKKNNINAFQNGKKIVVEFPTKAYLKYTVKYYTHNIPHEIYVGTEEGDVSDFHANNTTGRVSFEIENPAEYEITVLAKAFDENTYPSEEVSAENHIKIDLLKLDDPESLNSSLAVGYVFSGNKFATDADKTIRVIFTPAKINGNYVPTDYYTVYRRERGTYTNMSLPAVKESTDSVHGIKYYVDDNTVTDITKNYVYTVVVSDGECYAEKASRTLLAKQIELIDNIDIEVFSTDDKKVIWTVTTFGDFAPNATLVAKYLAVENNRVAPVLGEEVFKNASSVELKLTEQNGGNATSRTYKTDATGVIETSKASVYLVVEATLNGYDTTYVISDEVKHPLD